MSVVELAQKIINCGDFVGQIRTVAELSEMLGVPEDEINLAIDWLVAEKFGESWIVPDECVDQDEDTEHDREHLEACLNSDEEIIVDAEWLQSVWNLAQELMEGEG